MESGNRFVLPKKGLACPWAMGVAGGAAFGLLLLALVGCSPNNAPKATPQAQKGVLDLKGWSLRQDGPVFLNGEWAFYWGELLGPQDFEQDKPPQKSGLIKVPGVWNGADMKEGKIPAFGYATYRLVVKTPERIPRLALRFRDQGSAMRVIVNGRSVSQGRVGRSKEATTPSRRTVLYRFGVEQRPIEIILHIANFHHINGGTFHPIRLGTVGDVFTENRNYLLYSLFLSGAILVMGVYHLGLFFYRRKNVSALLLAVLSFLMALRIVTTGERFLLEFVPQIPWQLAFRLDYLSFYLFLPVFAAFIHTLFPRELPQKLLYIILALTLPFTGVVLFAPPYYIHLTMRVYQFITIGVGVVVLFVMGLASLRKREGSFIFTMGVLALFVAGLNDILSNMRIIDTYHYMTPSGLFVLLLAQVFILIKTFTNAYNRAEVLSQELDAKVRDRTLELRRANEQLKEMDQLKTNFFANISHEIRTPLTLILSPVESALQGEYDKGIDEAFLANIQRNGIRLLKLINNMLDFSKLEAGRMHLDVGKVDMAEFVKGYLNNIESAAASKKIRLRSFFADDSFDVYIDKEKMDKVIMNILSNALKFTGEDGSIDIAVYSESGICRLEVTDTGQGIPESQLESIFDRFGRADSATKGQYEGTGIGLSLARELVKLHGGDIAVSSKTKQEYPGEHGSTFSIRLPLGKSHLLERDDVRFVQESEVGEGVSEAQGFVGMREMVDLQEGSPGGEGVAEPSFNNEGPGILVVDDNREMRSFLRELLQPYYQVHLAQDGQQALEAVRLRQPGLVVSDVMMPVMNGYEMTRRIKEDDKTAHIPVLMITAKADLSYKLEGLEYGADDYLTKPFNSKELLARIKSLLKIYEQSRIISQRNKQIERELETARSIQRRLLPESLPTIPGIDIYAQYLPMDKVGGDLYDLFYSGEIAGRESENYLDVFIADVSGHGLASSLMASMTKMAMESVDLRETPQSKLSSVNESIGQYTFRGSFVTAFYASIDLNNKIMTYSNAGHFPPYVHRRSQDRLWEINTKGSAMGWRSPLPLEQKKIELVSGDRLIFFTDGVIEAGDADNELYGEERFRDFIHRHGEHGPESFGQNLIDELQSFAGRSDLEDDLTLVVVDVQ